MCKQVLTRIDFCVILYVTIEAHPTKSIALFSPRAARPCEKGVDAEVYAVAKHMAGSAENIRPVVAEMRRAIIHTNIMCIGR